MSWFSLIFFVVFSINIAQAQLSNEDLVGTSLFKNVVVKERASTQASGNEMRFKSTESKRTEDEEEYERYKRAARQGDADAQYNLAKMYEKGKGIKKNLREAFSLYMLSAEQGSAEAQEKVGQFYNYGMGEVVQDNKKAKEWYERAAKQGNYAAQSRLKILKRDMELLGIILKVMSTPYMLVSAQDQCDIGTMYFFGRRGVEQNNEEAYKWFTKAAKKGNAEAQHKLAKMYRYGHGIEVDVPQAVKWYKRAAKQGNIYSQYELAMIYHTGQGKEIRENNVLAYAWMKIYIDSLNDPETTFIDTLKEWKLTMSPKQIAQAEETYKNLSQDINKPTVN